jgi:hypothetical protein
MKWFRTAVSSFAGWGGFDFGVKGFAKAKKDGLI